MTEDQRVVTLALIRRHNRRITEQTNNRNILIRRGSDLGLSTRELAEAAGVSNATVWRIINPQPAETSAP